MKKSLPEYMQQYREEHTHLGTRLTHLVGIPMIVASIPVLPFNPPLAAGLFVGGWAFQLVGHYVFEKHNPSFLNDPFYLLVGPLWVAAEIAEMAGVHLPYAAQPTSPANGHSTTINVEAMPAVDRSAF
jgi:uncharacterized membrane protein YGL010W